MPIYEYECTKCGETFEIYRSVIEPDEQEKESFDTAQGRPPCPKCGEGETERVFSVFSGGSSSSCGPAPAGTKFG